MQELVILSGKGGTGKTSITSAFASLAENSVFCDADVDAADLHLILHPEIKLTSDFTGGYEAKINAERCSQCGDCVSVCRFKAIKDTFEIDPFECEGCGVCVDLCPVNAIDFTETVCGQWHTSDTRFGPMVHAQLGIGQENSGKLVSLVRQEAKKIAQKNKKDLILTDGPPGIGCPVIAAIGQATAVLIVTEPSISGLHDFQRICELCRHFKLPAAVCVNKYDLNPDMTKKIEAFAAGKGIPVAGKIPFDSIFVESMVQVKNIFETARHSQACMAVREIWKQLLSFSALNQHQPEKLTHFL